MNPQTWWFVARASGYVGWGLVTASVLTGLLLGGRATRRTGPAWTLDIHRFMAGTAVVFTGLHVTALVADSYVHFGAADVLVPLASSWRSGAVALGVVAMYLLAAVEITSLLMRRIPRRWWKGIHLSSYVLFWSASFHLLTAGTDAHSPASRLAGSLAMGAVAGLTAVRVLSRPTPARRPKAPGRRAATGRPSAV